MHIKELTKEGMQNIYFPCTPFCIDHKYTETSSTLHVHDFHQLTIITHGTAELVINNTPYPLQAGNIYVLPSFLPHYLRNMKNLEVSNILFYMDELNRHADSLRLDDSYRLLFYLQPTFSSQDKSSNILFLSHDGFQRIEKIVSTMLTELKNEELGCDIVVQSYFMILITLLSRELKLPANHKKANLELISLVNYLQEHYEEDFTVERMTAYSNLADKKLRDLFRIHYNCTPMEYLRKIRLEKSEYLLLSSDMNISEIAAAVGFDDSNYFSRVFQETYHVTPRDYRKGNQSG